MATNPLTPKEKKIRNLRKILWIVFAAIAATIILIFSLSIPVGLLINNANHFLAAFSNDTGLLLLSLAALALVKIAVAGFILLVIYYILKYRFEKDDDLFL